MDKENLRVNAYAVGATTALQIAGVNRKRWKLRITARASAGILIGPDRNVDWTTAFFIPDKTQHRVEVWKGEVWALTPSSTGRVYVWEESQE
jgi:hypothetical protein